VPAQGIASSFRHQHRPCDNIVIPAKAGTHFDLAFGQARPRSAQQQDGFQLSLE